MLPELLRNNYLDDTALSLVKNIQTDEIWKRLKKVYEDTKITFSKGLTELENLEPIWKIESPSKISCSFPTGTAWNPNFITVILWTTFTN